MSTKKRVKAETPAEQPKQPEAQAERVEKSAQQGPRVYCGPSVRGVARQYTVYAGDIPAALKDFIAEHPAARGLLVPVSAFAQTRKKLETAGTAEAILYKQVKADIS